MNFPAPSELSRRAQFRSGKAKRQRLRLDLRPIEIKVVHLEGDHLILLPLRRVDILQIEIRAAKTQTRNAVFLPKTPEPQLAEEFDGELEIRP